MGRRLCALSLFVILIACISIYSPWDIIGAYSKANMVDSHLYDGQHIHGLGKVTRKENKGDKLIYYIDGETIYCENGQLKNISFIFKSDSDSIPSNCKVNIDGTVALFNVATNEGGFDMKGYYNSLGYYFELTDVKLLDYPTTFLSKYDFFYKLSSKLLSVYLTVLPGEEAGFLASVTIGNKSELDRDLKSLFQLVGVAHILAVSGLHVSVVCMSIYRFLRNRSFSFAAAGVVSGLISIFYGLLTGGSISSVRAIGMFLIYLLADVLGESYDSPTALSLMAMLLVLKNPLYLTNSSFIFSFGAILGIFYIAMPISKRFMLLSKEKIRLIKYDNGYSVLNKPPFFIRFLSWFMGSLVFSFGIYVAMLPIVTYMFYETPIYSIFLNLMVLPLMPVLLGFGLIGGIVGMVSIGASKIILLPCHIIIYGFELLADLFAKIPFSSLIVGRHSIILIFIYYTLLIAVVHISKFTDFDLESINPRNRIGIIRKKFLVQCGLIFVVGLLGLIPRSNAFEVDILDVGQGDGIFVSSGDGVNFFIDGGSTSSYEIGKYTILPFLKYKGIRHIDYWFLSHMDEDHISGVIELLNMGYSIDNIVLSAEIPYDDTLSELLDLASDNNTSIIYMQKGDVCGSKHLSFKCVYPYAGVTSDDINALSLSLLMEYDRDCDGIVDYSGFFGGDLGKEQEQIIAKSGLVAHVDLLKVSHHGSRFSSDSTFLDALSPNVAVISCSKTNRYGHPANEAISRLEASCGKIYYTMKSGRVKCTLSGVEGFVD